MKSNLTSRHPAPRLTGLLCAGLVALALPAFAGDKHHNRDHGSYTHHYNSHYGGYSGGHSRGRNFDHYDPSYGYYNGYYDDYPVYSPRYQGHGSYGHSNYGRSRHNSITFQLHLR